MASPKNLIDDSTDAFRSQSNNQGTCSSSEPTAASSECKKTQLRADFQPSNHSVVCGRSKEGLNHAGNRRFRILASIFLDTYSQTDSKAAKSAIVSEIITAIRQGGGHFCKYESGAWFEVGDHYARKKVGALLRDLLHTQYRSSTKAKVGHRLQAAMLQPNENPQSTGQKQVEETDDSDDSSAKQVEGNEDSDDSSTTSSCWGKSKNSLGFEYWLEESDDFFKIDVF
jgi:hypothetical protein